MNLRRAQGGLIQLLGKNCSIHAGVNVGAHHGMAPIVGNNVYMGPGAKIVGAVCVGNDAVIGANAVVVKDVPSIVTMGGVPAVIIQIKTQANYFLTGVVVTQL